LKGDLPLFFNSLNYLCFFTTIFIVYWFCLQRSRKAQNIFILCASYFFYGMWDWRFLSLLVLSSTTDYAVGIFLDRTDDRKRRILLLSFSLLINLGLLFVFKYFNFFNEQFIVFMSRIGVPVNAASVNIILPVGISFYTFQTLSYTIDVYKKKIPSTTSIIDFFAYVSFFPQLVAGPIERAAHLLPQFQKKRIFVYEKAVLGCKLIVWGLFKKTVVADNCAMIVDHIFAQSNFSTLNPFWLFVGSCFFAFQIYCDFSGYSDMAIGSAKLLGFDLRVNFRTPYFSRDIPEFWRRWHISLTSWFKDYLYIPLGGNKRTRPVAVRNVFIIFLVSGIWHGANWTFLFWGFYSALCFMPSFIQGKNRLHVDDLATGGSFPKLNEVLAVVFTFLLVCLGWVFFRSPSIAIAIDYIMAFFRGVFETNLAEYAPFTLIQYLPKNLVPVFINSVVSIVFLLTVEWFGRANHYIVDFSFRRGTPAFIFYNLIFFMILVLAQFNNQEFIYFQF
jgi:alginate O-acetyltransferase complex protein AlgI